MRKKPGASAIAVYLILLIPAILMAGPFYWVLTSSFKTQEEIFNRPSLLVQNPTIDNFTKLLTVTQFPRWFFNSLFTSICYMALALFFCSLAGYAFAKHDFPYKNILFVIILSSVMVPIYAVIVPLFLIFTKIGLINTYFVLILPGSANAFGIFLMRQYIQGIPTDMLDSARIDGYSEIQIYYRIVVPVIKPAIGALAIFAFLFSWNNLLRGLIFMRTSDMFTVPVGLASLVGLNDPQYGWLMAGSIISVLPVIVIFLRMQREFIEGLTLGSVKG